jgi:hypothetical protein
MRKMLLVGILSAMILTGCVVRNAICSSDGGVYEQDYSILGSDRTVKMDGQTCMMNKDGSFTVKYVDGSIDN